MLKNKIKYVLLFLIIIYGFISSNRYITATDWDVFEGNESDEYFLSDWRMLLKTTLVGNFNNKSSLLYDSSSETEQNINTSLNMVYQGDLRQKIGLSADFGVDIDLDESRVEAGINELLLPVIDNGNMIIDAGVISTNFGSSLFFNPVNYFNRYVSDPRKQGSYGFLGTKLSYFDESNFYALYYFPRVSLMDRDNNNIVLLRRNTYLSGKRFSFYLFAEEKDSWNFNDPFLGFGLDSSFSIGSDYIFNGQLFYSNGEAENTVKELGVDRVPLLIPDERSKEDFFLDFYVSLNTVLFDDLDLTFAYLYNGRGLSGSEINTLLSGLEDSRGKFYFIDALNSAAGLIKSPYIYSEHLGLINTTIKNFYNNMTLNHLWFIDLMGKSFQLNNSLLWDLSNNTEMEFNYMYCTGENETLFGSVLNNREISLVINYHF